LSYGVVCVILHLAI